MKSENEFSVCKLTDKSYVVVNQFGGIDHMMIGRKFVNFEKASGYLESHQNAKKKFDKWLGDRSASISKWLHETQHYRYDCDGGSLAVRIDGKSVLRVGNGGDGNHHVYVLKSVPEFFKFTGFSLCDCMIEPLDYDCAGGKPLCRHEVKSACFYRYNDIIAIAVEE